MVNLGDRLRNARIKQGLSLEDVSSATKIRVSFLSALEDGQYNRLPSSAYAEGFVGNYAEFLGLPKKETIAVFRREFDVKTQYKVLPEAFSDKKKLGNHRFNFGQSALFIGGFLIIVGYLLFQYRFVLSAPALEVIHPKEGEKILGNTVAVSGKASVNSSVFVDEQPVPVDKSGLFRKNLSVFNGKAIITVKARNRLGKETVVKRKIEVIPQQDKGN